MDTRLLWYIPCGISNTDRQSCGPVHEQGHARDGATATASGNENGNENENENENGTARMQAQRQQKKLMMHAQSRDCQGYCYVGDRCLCVQSRDCQRYCYVGDHCLCDCVADPMIVTVIDCVDGEANGNDVMKTASESGNGFASAAFEMMSRDINVQ
jgi:hypothetical protein